MSKSCTFIRQTRTYWTSNTLILVIDFGCIKCWMYKTLLLNQWKFLFWKKWFKQIHFHAFAFLHAFAFHIFILYYSLIHAFLIFFRHYIKTYHHESWTTYSASILHPFQSKSNGRGSGYSSRMYGESSLGATRKTCKNMWWRFPNNGDAGRFDQGKAKWRSFQPISWIYPNKKYW